MIELRECGFTFPRGQNVSALQVLENINLTIAAQECVCLLGPSGCGKTTLLKLIAGLLLPTSGQVWIDGKAVTGPGHDRAMVFQNFALLPWANVLDNIAFGLELRGVPKAERLRAAQALAQDVGLTGFERHYPKQLSGGMQQRVGLARALAIEPRILLLDEPFSALDAQTRRLLQEDFAAMQQRAPRTVVFVTHSMDEAVRLGDRVALLSPRPGRIREIIAVPIPQPRTVELEKDARYIELKEYLWEQLRAMHVMGAEGE
jgi:ABC-type nitrate/sulfonate/bicarbonate transport system ATPase subunit